MSKSGRTLAPPRTPLRPPKEVVAWLRPMRLKRTREHLSISDPDLTALAGLLTLVGTPSSPEGKRVFYILQGLLFQKRRTPRFRSAVQEIPPARERLLGLADVAKAFGDLNGPLDRAHCRIDVVIRVMLQVPHPEAYLLHLRRKNMTALGVVFHPNTLTRVKKEARGLFSGTKGEDGYWSRTAGSLNIVDD
jgi:hypothetical protein